MGWNEPLVRVFNRVRAADGSVVPHEAYFDGQVYVIHDHVDLPWGIARIVVHNSMYKIDPVTSGGAYRLGCTEFGIPTDVLPLSEVTRDELYDRAMAPPHAGTLTRVAIHNPIRRHDPIMASIPGTREDGVFPGMFGDKL